MSYCCAPYEETPDGWRPPFPDGTSYLLIASPGTDMEWGLFDTGDDPVPVDPRITPVPLELETLLESAKSYPPAIALARDAAEDLSMNHAEFLASYAVLLRELLRAQPTYGYELHEAARDEFGYLERGAFYWVLGESCIDGRVDWVSSDYFVYQNKRSDFIWPESHGAVVDPTHLTSAST